MPSICVGEYSIHMSHNTCTVSHLLGYIQTYNHDTYDGTCHMYIHILICIYILTHNDKVHEDYLTYREECGMPDGMYQQGGH